MKILQRLARRFRSGNWDRWPDTAYQLASYRDRLQLVQRHLAEALQNAPPGPLRILSICAGDGRDVIGVLAGHPRQADATAALVEWNPDTVTQGIDHVHRARLEGSVTFFHRDATNFSTYVGLAPAEIVLVCGVWGHVPARERPQLVQSLTALCVAGGCVIWTRGVSKGMERLRQIQSHFMSPTWQALQVSTSPEWAVATYQYRGLTMPLPTQGRLFRFRPGAGTR